MTHNIKLMSNRLVLFLRQKSKKSSLILSTFSAFFTPLWQWTDYDLFCLSCEQNKSFEDVSLSFRKHWLIFFTIFGHFTDQKMNQLFEKITDQLTNEWILLLEALLYFWTMQTTGWFYLHFISCGALCRCTDGSTLNVSCHLAIIKCSRQKYETTTEFNIKWSQAGLKLDWNNPTENTTTRSYETRMDMKVMIQRHTEQCYLNACTWQLSASPLKVPPPSPAPQSSLCPPGRVQTCRRHKQHSGETKQKTSFH